MLFSSRGKKLIKGHRINTGAIMIEEKMLCSLREHQKSTEHVH
jgi:hypothetical protein